MGYPLDHPDIRRAIEKGLIPLSALEPSPSVIPMMPVEPEPAEVRKPVLVESSFTPPGCWVLPIETASEANGREWRKRSGRTQAARRAVSVGFGKELVYAAVFAFHYHAGGTLRVVFTRIGGQRLDRSNLSGAFKATEDAVCLMLGASDGDPRWAPDWEQQPGPGPVGVKVELFRLETPNTRSAA